MKGFTLRQPSKYKYSISSRQALYGAAVVIVILTIITLVSSGSGSVLLQTAQKFVGTIGLWAPIIFTFLYIIFGLVGFSTTVMAFVAIGLFNPFLAFLSIMIGSIVTAFFAFSLAHSSRLRLIIPGMKGLSSRRSVVYISKQIERQSKVHGFRLMLLLRLARLPYIALSYAAGFSAKITTKDFLLATALSNTVSITILVFIGVAALSYFAVATAVVVGGFVVYWLWRRWRLSSVR